MNKIIWISTILIFGIIVAGILYFNYDYSESELDQSLEEQEFQDSETELNQSSKEEEIQTSENCEDTFPLESPVNVSLATSILYPGQIRGDDYKAHGGFRFDDRNTNDIEVRAAMDGYLLKAARYGGTGNFDDELQNFLFYVNECGIMVMHDHLLTLTPKLQEVFDKLPIGKEGDSRTTNIESKVYIEKGELLATEVGFKEDKNIFLDFGVYDITKTNGVEYSDEFRENNPSIEEYGTHALCWLDLLSPEDSAIVKSLPGADLVNGKESDYCD